MENWMKWVVEIQALAQSGLTYTKDVYDIERYERLREISAEMIANISDFPIEKVKELYIKRGKRRNRFRCKSEKNNFITR